MKIVIVGAGFTGLQLAKILVNEKNDVVLIDNDEDRTRYAKNTIDCAVIEASGNSLETLERAEISKADALVCVTESDEINMVTCSLVDTIYPNILKIARVRNYEYYVNRDSVNKVRAKLHEAINEKINEKLGQTFGKKYLDKFASKNSLDENLIEESDLSQRPIYGIDYMIHPDIEAANAIVRAVENGAISDVITFGDSDEKSDKLSLQITRIPVMAGSAFDGHKLMELRNITQIKMLVAFFEENGVTRLPDGNTVMTPNCTLGILSEKKDLQAILELAGSKKKELKKIMLFGAGKIGTLVANKMIEPTQSSFFQKFGNKVFGKKQDIVIIEQDENLALAASEKFPSARVFRADATDENFLVNEGINEFDLAICASHNHEMNMILSAFLESIGVKQTISLVSSSSFTAIAQKLGIDVAIPLGDVIVDSIMSHLRGDVVKGVHTINEGNLEIIECEIGENSKVIGKTVKEIAQNGKFLILLSRSSERSANLASTSSLASSSGVATERSEENSENFGEHPIEKPSESLSGQKTTQKASQKDSQLEKTENKTENRTDAVQNSERKYQIVNGNTVLEVGNHLVLIVVSELSSKVLEIFGNQV